MTTFICGSTKVSRSISWNNNAKTHIRGKWTRGNLFADLTLTLGNEISKIRPVVIISDDTIKNYLETIVIRPATSKNSLNVENSSADWFAGKQAEVAVDQIRTISKIRLKKKIDHLPSDKSAQLRRIITERYGE
ncbi:MAG: type II toxin-antitoxin system PemK/MazF family toxin [Dissulfurimicrobium sp.]|uniref:type II toxin-antitoxin system PemK/MazF family toxin n=1 Tax=Dissulfurimicrobium sp. TaxID=2022436 RepID=UPI0040498F66